MPQSKTRTGPPDKARARRARKNADRKAANKAKHDSAGPKKR
jgi:hypothetical protein